MTTRRDILAAMLGAPLAFAACRKRKRVPDGELAFRPETLGHRMRDEGSPEIPADKWQKTKIVIVGGGVAGLSAAWRLLSKGVNDFVLLEVDSAVGGTARSGANATSAYPWGAHYITAPMKANHDLVSLLRDFDLVEGEDASGEPMFKEEHLCREPQERVFAEEHWHEGLYLHDEESADDRAQFVRFKETIESFAVRKDEQGRRAFSVPIALGADLEDIRALDRMTMADWLAREKFTSKRLQWLVDYACRDDFGSRPTQTSAFAGIHYYASRLLGAGREPQPVLTWPAGNGFLVGKLRTKVGDRVRTGFAVTRVQNTSNGVEVTAIGAAPDAIGFRAEHAIVCAPQFIASRVVRDRAPTKLAYGAWMVANLTLSERPKKRSRAEHTMSWDNVLYDSPSLGYVVATHQTGRDYGPTVITYYYPLTDDDPRESRRRLLALGRDEWADIALADLERAHPDIREITTRLDVARWGHAMARPAPGTFFDHAAWKRQGAIHFAHTDLSGIALFEEAFYHGVRAADEALSDT